jgi:hypothetical protein
MVIFGGLMALVETLNALGVALSANVGSSESTQKLGSHLTVAALSIQFGVIAIFMCLAALFHRRCVNANIHTKAIRTMMITLYVSMMLILVRCIYRLVEHAGGNTAVDVDSLEALSKLSPILRYEVYFYIFEATLMLINSVLWNVWNPVRFLPINHRIYLARDGAEVEGEEDKDDRPLLAKTAHVLTFGVLFRKKGQTQRFQELAEYPGTNSLDGSGVAVLNQPK